MRFNLGIVIICTIVGIASASDSILTLKDVINRAINDGTNVKFSQNSIEQKQISFKQAGSDFLPSLSASTGTGTNGKLNTSEWSSSADVSLNVSYTFTPSSIMGYRASEKQLSSAVYENQQTINEVTTNAVELYVKVLYAEKKSATAKNNLDYQKTKLAEIEAFRTAGKKSIADVLQQKTAVAEGEASLLSAQQEYGRLMLSLYSMTGVPLNSNYAIDTTELPLLLGSIEGGGSVIREITVDSIPQVQAQQQSVAASENSLKGARLSYAPSISGSAGSSSSYGDITRKGYSWSEPSGRISLSLSYPIFDKFNRSMNVQKAQLNVQNAQLQLKELKRSVQLQHRQAIYDLEIAKKQLEVAETRLNASRQSLEAITERYNAGASTLVEVAMVNNSYLNAVNARLQQESAFVLAGLKLLSENGRISGFIEKLISSKQD